MRAVGIEDPLLDAELLLAEATGRNRAQLAADPEAEIPPPAARRFGEMVRRRLQREPVAYILGRRGFRHIELAVDPRVLIPRPETELLVELALELEPRRLLDIGTGSGAIALAIAAEMPDCEVVAMDTSAAALEVARDNAARLGLLDRVELVETTLPAATEEFDLIVANLPYVSEAEWSGLEPEVTEWEPREALLAGPNGLDVIRDTIAVLAAQCGRTSRRYPAEAVTSSGPVVALEVGVGQAAAVGGMLREAGLLSVETRADLAGIERVVVGRR